MRQHRNKLSHKGLDILPYLYHFQIDTNMPSSLSQVRKAVAITNSCSKEDTGAEIKGDELHSKTFLD